MFTLKRYVPPIYSGDQRRDFENTQRALTEYLLSLEGKQALVIHSGVYTPTITGVTNSAASTSAECQYARVDDTVTVSGVVQHDPTAAAPTLTEFRMSLPIASDFSAVNHCGGAGGRYLKASNIVETVAIEGDTTNNEASFIYMASSIANGYLAFSFTYKIL